MFWCSRNKVVLTTLIVVLLLREYASKSIFYQVGLKEFLEEKDNVKNRRYLRWRREKDEDNRSESITKYKNTSQRSFRQENQMI